MRRIYPYTELTILLVALLLWGGCGGDRRGPVFDEKFDALVDSMLADWGVPGVVVAVVKDGERVFAKGYGERKAGTGLPVSSQTLCNIASNTKAVTATAMGILVDEGRLHWDDPVKVHIPELQLKDPYLTEHMTIRDILAHRAGLPFLLGAWNDPDYGMEQLLADLAVKEPPLPFRDRHGYSNVGYALAGEIVARVSGLSWERFVWERILQPLEMANTYATPSRLVEMYGEPGSGLDIFFPAHMEGERVVSEEWEGFDYIYAPAAGIVTTAEDIGAWMIMQLNEGEYQGRRIVSEASIDEMHRPQIAVSRGWWELHSVLANLLVYDLGWVSYDHRGRRVDEHPGGGLYAVVALVPEEELGVAVFTNLWWDNYQSARMATALKLTIIDACLGETDTDWNAEYLARHAEWLERHGME